MKLLKPMKNAALKNLILVLLLICTGSFMPLVAQTTVRGRVIDSKNNQTIPGVTVSVKGTYNAVLTDTDGNYKIDVPTSNGILVFKFVGYKTQEIEIGDKVSIDIAMNQEDIALDEVVVMGYSQKKRSEIASAVSIVTADKMAGVTTPNVANMLQGKVAGVEIVNSSGAPGQEAEVRIRGVASVSAPQGPLYVVDGIIGGSYDANDVETITVLKDAGATGMYGSQANGGVIIITTKKGKSQDTQFEFKATLGKRVADQGHLKMMSGSELYDAQKELYRDYASGKIDILKFYSERPRELRTRNFNWEGNMFQPAMVQNYYLSARKANEKSSYYIGGSLFNEEGTLINTGYKKLNLHANHTYQFSDKIRVDNNFNISAYDGTSYDYMDMYYSYLSLPWDNPYDSSGNPLFVDGTSTSWWSRDKINPLHTIKNSNHEYKGFDVNYDLVLDYKITNWLSFSSSNRLSASTTKSHDFVSKLAAGTYYGKGYINESSGLDYGGISTDLLKFNFDGKIHSFSGLVGVEGQQDHFESLGAEGKGLPEGFSVPAVASKELLIHGYKDASYMQSFISQFNYNYKSKYFFTGSYRIDATSAFPPKNRNAHFPSVSAAWLVSNENFLKDLKMVDMLKLRASYGITGMKDIGAYKYMGLFDLSTQYNSDAAAVPYQLANPDLTWEKTEQFNIGFDLGLFDRLTINLDYYRNVTRDLLIQVAQPLSVGFEKKWENVGRVNNNGLELTLSTILVKSSDFQWTFDITYGTNSNRLKGIDTPIYQTLNGISQIYRNNGELYVFNLPKWLGVDVQTGAPLWEHLEKDANGNVTSRTPTSEYADATAQEVGHALPKFQGGFNTFLKYKRVSLSMNVSYMYGNDVYNFTRKFMDNDGHEPYYNLMKWKSGWSRWKTPGDVATHPSIQNSALSTENSSRYLEDGSYLKLRNVTLRYEIPQNIVKKLKLQQLAVSFSGDNLLTLTKYWGQDPEVTITPSTYVMPGVSDFKYPPNKQYVFTLEVKF
jgi:TonB-linked SusC/RagA family outer membrane protein